MSFWPVSNHWWPSTKWLTDSTDIINLCSINSALSIIQVRKVLSWRITGFSPLHPYMAQLLTHIKALVSLKWYVTTRLSAPSQQASKMSNKKSNNTLYENPTYACFHAHVMLHKTLWLWKCVVHHVKSFTRVRTFLPLFVCWRHSPVKSAKDFWSSFQYGLMSNTLIYIDQCPSMHTQRCGK